MFSTLTHAATLSRGPIVDWDVIALTGQNAPDSGGAIYGSFSGAVMNDGGDVAFGARQMTGQGVSGVNNRGIYTQNAKIMRLGDVVPSLPTLKYNSFGLPSINNAGQVGFYSRVFGPGLTPDNAAGLFVDQTLKRRNGDPAPGAPGRNIGAASGPVSLSGSGEIAVLTALTNPNEAAPVSSSQVIAKRGDAAPGVGGGFTSFSEPVFASETSLGFIAEFDGAASDENSGVFVNGALTLREGDAAPGAGGAKIGFMRNLAVNAQGDAALLANLTGAGVGFENDLALLTPGALIAREGGLAPSAGETFKNLFVPSMNDLGEIGFLATLTSPQLPSNGLTALFLNDGKGGLTELMRLGDVLSFGGGDMRKITGLELTREGLSDYGLALTAGFADGSYAVLRGAIARDGGGDPTTPVPLPSAGVMLFAALAGLSLLHRRD